MLAAAAQGNATLDDVVAFRTGLIVDAQFLLLAPRIVIDSGSMVMRCFAEDGTALADFPNRRVNPSARIVQRDQLPKDWIDLDKPWHCQVDEVIAIFELARKQSHKRFGDVILVDAKVPDGTAYIQLGLRDAAGLIRQGLGRPSYFVGVVETLTAAEVERNHISRRRCSRTRSPKSTAA